MASTKLSLHVLTLIKTGVFKYCRKPGDKLYHPHVLRIYATDPSEIRYAYGSDHFRGLPIGSVTKYPELKFSQNFPESPEFFEFP